MSQTYTDLDIILINDGSTDNSGIIANSYNDSRIRLFHTENQGLSAARNLGIEKAIGEYISFIDADDWIDPDFYDNIISQIDDADIISFGYTETIDNSKKLFHSHSGLYSGQEALTALINSHISPSAWSKLYKKECFSSVRFPEGRICEDTATTYKLFLQSSQIISIDYTGYHYRYRNDSLSHKHTIKLLTDLWLAHKERYYYCKDHVDKATQILLLQYVAMSIAFAWTWKNSITKDISPVFSDMSQFVTKHLPHHIRRFFPFKIKIGSFFAKFNNPLSFWFANKLLFLSRFFQGKTID